MQKKFLPPNRIPWQNLNPNPDMQKFDNWLVGVLGLLGGGISKTLLSIPTTLFGLGISLGWAALSTGVGYLTKLIIDAVIKRIRIFIDNNRTKKSK